MNIRFAVPIVAIVGALAYLAFVGIEEGKTYYHTCSEVAAMGDEIYDSPIRLAGKVVDGSIRYDGDIMHFDLEYEGARYAVRYASTEPIPDTFKDGVEAVVDGQLSRAGVFEGEKIQAKCASKYEAEYDKPGEAGATDPTA